MKFGLMVRFNILFGSKFVKWCIENNSNEVSCLEVIDIVGGNFKY